MTLPYCFYFCSKFSTFLKLISTILSSLYTFIPPFILSVATNVTSSLFGDSQKLFLNTLSACPQAMSSPRTGKYSTLYSLFPRSLRLKSFLPLSPSFFVISAYSRILRRSHCSSSSFIFSNAFIRYLLY